MCQHTSRAGTLAWREGPAWVITVGTHATKDELKKAVTDEGHEFSTSALGLIDTDGFTIETTLRQIGLFTATVAEIGFLKGGEVEYVYAKLDELGYGVCPDETALQLRREYKDQPIEDDDYDCLEVVTEPKADANGRDSMLRVVRHSHGSWVRWASAYPCRKLDADIRLVFCLKSQLAA